MANIWSWRVLIFIKIFRNKLTANGALESASHLAELPDLEILEFFIGKFIFKPKYRIPLKSEFLKSFSMRISRIKKLKNLMIYSEFSFKIYFQHFRLQQKSNCKREISNSKGNRASGIQIFIVKKKFHFI